MFKFIITIVLICVVYKKLVAPYLRKENEEKICRLRSIEDVISVVENKSLEGTIRLSDENIKDSYILLADCRDNLIDHGEKELTAHIDALFIEAMNKGTKIIINNNPKYISDKQYVTIPSTRGDKKIKKIRYDLELWNIPPNLYFEKLEVTITPENMYLIQEAFVDYKTEILESTNISKEELEKLINAKDNNSFAKLLESVGIALTTEFITSVITNAFK